MKKIALNFKMLGLCLMILALGFGIGPVQAGVDDNGLFGQVVVLQQQDRAVEKPQLRSLEQPHGAEQSGRGHPDQSQHDGEDLSSAGHGLLSAPNLGVWSPRLLTYLWRRLKRPPGCEAELDACFAPGAGG